MPAGQSTREYVRPLESYTWTFRAYSRERINEIKAIYRERGRGSHVWISPTEEDSSFLSPFYATIESEIAPVKNSIRYDFTWTFKEAR